jgi:O-antigen/teichoic acid export membrane protein
MTGQVLRGSFWYLGGQIVTLLASFLATPIVIRLLGPEQYGLWALIVLLVGRVGFTRLGMGTASTRFASEAHARGDDAGEAAILWDCLLLGALPAALAAAGLALGAPWLLDRVLHVPSHLQQSGVIALRLAAIALVPRVATSVLNSPQLVRLRMRLHGGMTVAGSLAQILLTPVVLLLGGGVAGAAAVIAGVAVAAGVGQAVVAGRILPELRRARLAPALLGRLASFGGAVAAANLCLAMLTHGEKLLLIRFVSVSALAYYTVAFSLANLLVVPAAALVQSLLPTFARCQASERWDELGRLYDELLRAILLLLPPLALLLGVGAKPFFTLWAGPAFGTASTPLFFILLVGLLAHVLAHVPTCLLVALGRADFDARYHLLELAPYLLLALLLTMRWGGAGAAAAWSLRLLVALPIYLRAAGRHLPPLHRKALRLGRGYAGALAALVLPPLGAALAGFQWPNLLLAGASSVAFYLWMVFALLLRPEERAWVRARLPV